ncbi:MAG: hypothetical protein FWC64_12855 [Treponema sp.]|nr:hypothetical protein [Treponema sp.]
MANFYASKQWVILLPPDIPEIKRAAEDLSRYIGLLAGFAEGLVQKPPALLDAHAPIPSNSAPPLIVLSVEGSGPERNGFSWKAGPERIEIRGESSRGLCNGIYSFLSALGISWPGPGEEVLPSSQVSNLRVFSLSSGIGIDNDGCTSEPSKYDGGGPVAAPWRRFVPAGEKEVSAILKKGETFVAWAARRRYDVLVLPLRVFACKRTGRKLNELKKAASEYDIALEAGGRDISSLVPRRSFLFHRDFFRMEGGHRKKDHHFCPTNPGTTRLIGKEGERLFRAAGEVRVFHLWPDKGADAAWCSCSTCRAFTPAEQNRIGVNIAADVLAAMGTGAFITFFEKPGEGGNLPLRQNLSKLEKLPDEKEFR